MPSDGGCFEFEMAGMIHCCSGVSDCGVVRVRASGGEISGRATFVCLPAREVLQLSIYCMKTGFSSYHTPESIAAPLDNEDPPLNALCAVQLLLARGRSMANFMRGLSVAG